MRSLLIWTMILWSGIIQNIAKAQISDTWSDSIYMLYPFLNHKDNVLNEESSEALSIWFSHLQKLIEGTEHQVRVLHIGDSHIQADFFPGTMRMLLQKQFGNAGRGYVFPYSIAKNYNAKDVFVTPKGTWTWSRSASNLHGGPAGVSGYGLATKDCSAGITISINSGELDYRFNRITVFEKPSQHSYTLNVSQDGIQRCINTETFGNGASTSFLDGMSDTVHLSYQKDYSSQTDAEFYGISLENNNSGILYHSAGQNGAYVRSFLKSSHFLPQLEALNPQLIVISIGTNDAFVQNNRLCLQCFKDDYQQLIQAVKAAQPNTAILLSTPPDFYLKRKYHCSDVRGMSEVIHKLAKEEACAVWDLHHVMGSDGSMLQWKEAGLAAGDLVHFSETGYRIQGLMLHEAMMNAFEQYLQK